MPDLPCGGFRARTARNGLRCDLFDFGRPGFSGRPARAPGQVQYIMAVVLQALASAVEVNEDSEELGQRDIARRRPTRQDVVVGLSVFGTGPTQLLAAGLRPRARS